MRHLLNGHHHCHHYHHCLLGHQPSSPLSSLSARSSTIVIIISLLGYQPSPLSYHCLHHHQYYNCSAVTIVMIIITICSVPTVLTTTIDRSNDDAGCVPRPRPGSHARTPSCGQTASCSSSPSPTPPAGPACRNSSRACAACERTSDFRWP